MTTLLTIASLRYPFVPSLPSVLSSTLNHPSPATLALNVTVTMSFAGYLVSTVLATLMPTVPLALASSTVGFTFTTAPLVRFV